MKIALLGYGKMGKVIETIALNRGHEISLKVDKYSIDYDLSSVDVAINFSTPKSAVENISKALESNVPVISGTTGESVTVSDKEKVAIINTIKQANNNRVPLVLGIGGNNTGQVINEINQTAIAKPTMH